MRKRILWSKTVELSGFEEFMWMDDALATIAHAIKTGDKNDFQGWIPEHMTRRIREVPDIRLTKGSHSWSVHSLSYGNEVLETHEVVLQQYLKTFRPAGEIVITWAEVSPMWESDGFSGGLSIISSMGSSRSTIKDLLGVLKS